MAHCVRGMHECSIILYAFVNNNKRPSIFNRFHLGPILHVFCQQRHYKEYRQVAIENIIAMVGLQKHYRVNNQ